MPVKIWLLSLISYLIITITIVISKIKINKNTKKIISLVCFLPSSAVLIVLAYIIKNNKLYSFIQTEFLPKNTWQIFLNQEIIYELIFLNITYVTFIIFSTKKFFNDKSILTLLNLSIISLMLIVHSDHYLYFISALILLNPLLIEIIFNKEKNSFFQDRKNTKKKVLLFYWYLVIDFISLIIFFLQTEQKVNNELIYSILVLTISIKAISITMLETKSSYLNYYYKVYYQLSLFYQIILITIVPLDGVSHYNFSFLCLILCVALIVLKTIINQSISIVNITVIIKIVSCFLILIGYQMIGILTIIFSINLDIIFYKRNFKFISHTNKFLYPVKEFFLLKKFKSISENISKKITNTAYIILLILKTPQMLFNSLQFVLRSFYNGSYNRSSFMVIILSAIFLFIMVKQYGT